MIKYNISYMAKNGLRTLMGANQGRFFKDTREDAEQWLHVILTNTGEDKLVEIYGKQVRGTFRVDAFSCYEHGDAKSVYIDEGPKEPCPRCGMMHAAGEYVARTDIPSYSRHGGVAYCPPDVTCTCGALLRHSVPLHKINTSGWVWRIL
jgi:hypothetical protein